MNANEPEVNIHSPSGCIFHKPTEFVLLATDSAQQNVTIRINLLVSPAVHVTPTTRATA
jgi:hypothetical protein